MAAFYGRKIQKQEINSKTGNPWTIEDVPDRWQTATQNWLNTH